MSIKLSKDKFCSRCGTFLVFSLRSVYFSRDTGEVSSRFYKATCPKYRFWFNSDHDNDLSYTEDQKRITRNGDVDD